LFDAIVSNRFRVASIAARILTACVGGYAAAAALTTLLARALPIDRTEATSWGLLLSFPAYAALALWTFAAARPGRVAAIIWVSATASAVALYLLGIRP